jgi:hypothetical protein
MKGEGALSDYLEKATRKGKGEKREKKKIEWKS